MAETDLTFAQHVRNLAGWNQRHQDWQRLLAHDPQGCFVAEWDGQLAGTATTTTYSQDLAWIGMVLVHPDMRRRGIGKALLVHCIDHLGQCGVRCIKLDATPMGKHVYEPLGFLDEWDLSRWGTTGSATCQQLSETSPDPGLRQLDGGEDTASAADLDTSAFGVSRERMLALLAAQSETIIRTDGDGRIVGYGMLRPGERAFYLGPVVVEDESTGIALAETLLGSTADRPVYWDIPDSNQAAVQFAQRYGLQRQRTLTRMYLGENTRPGSQSAQWAIAAPEIG